MLLLHLVVSLFGLVGIAVMVPNPELWSGWTLGASLFPLAVQQGGNVQILLGAAAVLTFGAATVGWRPTMIFFLVSVVLSLALEFTGTSYGWPFGNYEYTDMFGFKILGKVPPAIPLSWFFMGFSSFGLAAAIIRKWRGAAGLWSSIMLGTVLLTIWDFVLDPAMSHDALSLRYWIWEDSGPYLGVPLVNFLGWLGTGLVFMFASSCLDRRLRPIHVEQDAFFLLIYLCNLVFAVGICLANQIWLPSMLGALLIGLILFGWFRPGIRTPAFGGGI
ncbi:carotenoid biosynthesis protein [Thermaurantiacus sp.]